MKRRLIAAASAALLALLGIVLTLNYVAGADRRAMAGMQTTRVLVVTKPVPQGTPADKLAALVAVRTLPAVAVAPGHVANLGEVQGLVTTVALEPGEQLLASRFVDPAAQRDPNEVAVPAGLHRVSLQLERQRVAGGEIKPGDTVGVFISVERDKVTETHLALRRVLVSRVEGGATATADDEQQAAPAETLLITLATNSTNAEKIIFAAEHGTIWLSLEPAGATGTTRVLTKENVYK